MKTAVFRGFRFAALLVFAAAAAPTLRADVTPAAEETTENGLPANAAGSAVKPAKETSRNETAAPDAKPAGDALPEAAARDDATLRELPPMPDPAKPRETAQKTNPEPAENPAPALPEMPEPDDAGAGRTAPQPESESSADDENAPRPVGREARLRSLGALIAAMVSEDDELKIDHLLRAVEAEPFDTDAALIHLALLCSKRQNAAAALKRFDALWERFPSSRPLARSGCALHRAAGEDAHGAALLDRSLAAAAPPHGADDGELFALRLERLGFFCRMQKFAEAGKFIARLLPEVGERRSRLLEAALELHATGALRTEGGHKPAADWINSAHPCRRAHAETLLALRRCDGEILSRKICDNRIALYQRHGRHDFALTLAEEFAQRFPGPESQLRICAAAAEAGDVKTCETTLCILPPGLNPGIAAALRFRARLRAKDLRAAELFLEEPEAETIRQRARLDLFAAQRNYPELLKGAIEFARRGPEETMSVSALLLTAAERCGDRSALDLVRGAVGSAVTTEPVYANAVGYISAMIGGDLDEASRLVEFALSREPENAAYLDSLGCIRLRQGKIDEAEKLIRHALRRADLDTGIAVLLEHAADIAEARGRHDEALAGYRGALALAEEDTEIDPAALRRKIAALEGKKSE